MAGIVAGSLQIYVTPRVTEAACSSHSSYMGEKNITDHYLEDKS